MAKHGRMYHIAGVNIVLWKVFISLGVSFGDCSPIVSSSTFDLRTISCSEVHNHVGNV
jgi:hypothetical protein